MTADIKVTIIRQRQRRPLCRCKHNYYTSTVASVYIQLSYHTITIHHVFRNCLLRCARFAIYYTLAHSMFHRLLKFAFFVLLYVFYSFFLLLRLHILNKYFIIMYLMLF